MKIGRVFSWYGLVFAAYFVVLIRIDSGKAVFAWGSQLLSAMPVVMGASFFSYVLRFARWRWLLTRAGSSIPVMTGFMAYLAGFALTATPGKVGELLRIRYLAPLGVPPSQVIGAFVFEQAVDLVVVLMLASLLLVEYEMVGAIVGFVLIFLGGVVLCVMNPRILKRLAGRLRRLGLRRVSAWLRAFADGISGCRRWLSLRGLAVAIGIGLLAWGATSVSFVYLVNDLAGVPFSAGALAIYPLAMLAGVASMLPGGVGSTEATIAGLLVLRGCSLGTAGLAAIAIRVGTLWFAVFCGLVAVCWFETGSARLSTGLVPWLRRRSDGSQRENE